MSLKMHIFSGFHVAVINFPFWIYAPDYAVAPPPKRPRQHTGEVMASELSTQAVNIIIS